jgi:hypothetical protein
VFLSVIGTNTDYCTFHTCSAADTVNIFLCFGIKILSTDECVSNYDRHNVFSDVFKNKINEYAKIRSLDNTVLTNNIKPYSSFFFIFYYIFQAYTLTIIRLKNTGTGGILHFSFCTCIFLPDECQCVVEYKTRTTEYVFCVCVDCICY